MGNTMTITAFCKLIMNCRAVWLSVAFLASRQLAMAGMAFGACQGRMLCLTYLQQLVWLVMTAGTDFLALGNGIGDIKRGVHRVTSQTVRSSHCYHGAMVLVTF